MNNPTNPLPPLLLTHLLQRSPARLLAATHAPFLAHAGRGQLSLEQLSAWLTQDRIYAQAYLRFAARLLAAVPLPRQVVSTPDLHVRIADWLLAALVNVRRELGFFEDVAVRWGVRLDAWSQETAAPAHGEAHGLTEGTRAYLELFEDVGARVEAGRGGLLGGLVVLWGTEKCYLESWRYARSFLESTPQITTTSSSPTNPDQDAATTALRDHLIPNWTSDDFVHFVNDIDALVTELWQQQCHHNHHEHAASPLKLILEPRPGTTGTTGTETQPSTPELQLELARLEALWERVLDVEIRFWPEVEET
ncbi:MAG: hypothetical protein M1818_008207 [Claussenomyces sp. TS43310]|nr:MAG: hypothetical protein M1818_008207 [Claussenomyces sp. TS43310]